jgi:predicted nucleic acid-binding protein
MGVAELQQTLAAYKLAFIDTMVWVYLLDEHPDYTDLAEVVIGLAEHGLLQACTSALTLAEILTGPAKKSNIAAVNDYTLYLTHFPNLIIFPVDVNLARQIALVRASTGLRTPDAIQIAVAMAAGADVIIGNDKSWRGKTGSLAFVLLDDFRN